MLELCKTHYINDIKGCVACVAYHRGYEDAERHSKKRIEELESRLAEYDALIAELEEELNARKEQLGYLQAAYNELKGRINRGEI